MAVNKNRGQCILESGKYGAERSGAGALHGAGIPAVAHHRCRFRAAWLGTMWVILVWGAFLVGSIVIIVKSIRRGQAGIDGQLGSAPLGWQRWVLDEHDERQRPVQRADPDDKHGS
jgi:hypothetical protein